MPSKSRLQAESATSGVRSWRNGRAGRRGGVHYCLPTNACAIIFSQSSIVPFLNVWDCRIPTKRYYQVMRKCPVHTRWFYYVVESRFQHYFGTSRGRHWKYTCRVPRSIRQKTWHLFSIISLRQQLAQLLRCTEKIGHLQLESRTSTCKRRRCWEANCGETAHHHAAGSNWVCWPRVSHEQVPRDPLRRLCSSLQQGHHLLQHRCQVQLPSWHQVRLAWSSHGRGTGMGHARNTFTCLTSSITSERAEILYSALSLNQQHLRQKERHCQEAHSYSSCHNV